MHANSDPGSYRPDQRAVSVRLRAEAIYREHGIEAPACLQDVVGRALGVTEVDDATA